MSVHVDVDCGAPPSVLPEDSTQPWAFLTSSNAYNTLYRSEREYACADGMVVLSMNWSASVIATCNADGVWSANELCEPAACVAPPNIPHSDVIALADVILFGDAVEYWCHVGFKLRNSSESFVSVCGSVGEWSVTSQQCFSKTTIC